MYVTFKSNTKNMAVSALEEKINKIRQQNEEIRRRHEEVEEDKKKAAKLNALVQMVPSTDWPERKEPPEFSNPSRTNNKLKSVKEYHEHQSTSGEGRKIHTFAQGQGPPPDPKYNFLADAEREEGERESTKDNSNKGQKYSRGVFKKKSGGKDATQREKDCRTNRGSHRDEHQPEYEAWRAERNRIDEDRISRQRTAEGNWRREWDNNKAHIVDEMAKTETKLGDNIKKDFKDFDKRYHVNGNDYVSHNRSSHRSYRGNSRHFHNNYENNSNSTHHQVGHIKNPSGSEKRTVVATDKSIKITLNQGNMAKGPVMSVKVNSPSIAGTGRVGPRQRSRLTYSSHSDVEIISPDTESFLRPKSYEDRPKGICYENLHKSSNSRKSQLSPKKKDFSNKSPYFRKKEIRREYESLQKYHEIKSSWKDHKELQKFCQSKFQKHEENIAGPLQDITTIDEKESNIIFSTESDMNNIEINNKDNQNYSNLNSHINEGRKVYADKEDKADLQNLDLPAFEIDTEIETCEKNGKKEDKLDEMQNIQVVVTFECENTKTKLTISSLENNNDKNEIQYVENSLCDANNTKEPIMKDKDSERTKEILKDNCDSIKQIKNMSEQENGIKYDAENSLEEKEINSITILPSTDIHYTEKRSDTLKSDDKISKGKIILAIEDEIATDEKINTDYKQDSTKCINETQECTDNKEKENNVTNSIVVDKIESLKENLHIEEKTVSNDQN
ncbi:PREDICTED: myb-like protein X isoform X1 [Atta colombica]|uniref:myb-like protein X isoform X1 n=1 Tax=Atta colombica TaxID=520822 RepID=UPI00084C9501|nr:PREDICTED: myb-like protein X isoform X1 [Atta colombica]